MTFLKYLNFFLPAPHIARLPQEEVNAKYKKIRWQVFIGITLGYTGFYLVRNNFAFAMPYLAQQGFTKTQLGLIFSALPLAYGLSKFLMAIVSDRSNPRYFMATGLILSTMANFFYGSSLVLHSFILMLLVLFFNGWAQGMGWPALARVMVHWFSRNERGTKMSIIGAMQSISRSIIGPLIVLGISFFGSWHSIFYFPAIIALVAVALVLLLVRDTPQSEGLPPIEEYHNEYRGNEPGCLSTTDRERELTPKEILFKYIFVNKYLWYLSAADIFVHLVRYGIISWAPTYLNGAKGFTLAESGLACFLYEIAAIPGVLLCGWLSDKIFHGRRTPICIIYMVGAFFAIMLYWFVPVGAHLYDKVALAAIGFFIYGPAKLIGVCALEVVPKKAAGTAAGLTGLLGHAGGTTMAYIGIGSIVDSFGWDAGFVMLLIACALAILALAFTWNFESVKPPLFIFAKNKKL